MEEFKDGGSRTEFSTGAVRDVQTGKGRFDLLPQRAIQQVAKIFETGGLKYGDRNWEKGIDTNRFVDSGMRHLSKFMRGERDEPHLQMAAWNLMCLIETLSLIAEGKLPEDIQTLPNVELKDFLLEDICQD